MSFKVLIKDDKPKIIKEPYLVYEYLVENFYKKNLKSVDENTHISAVDVQCWCELANAGDTYQGDDFSVECVYNF